MVSNHARQIQFIDPVVKFGIIFWFTGVAKYYTEHSIYRILFNRNNKSEDSGDKITLGMNESALMLKKEGYGDPETMNLNDYFDSQIKYLKDMINKAIAEGIKPEKLSQKSGIPMETINKLT